jgi:F-type H+-transporting ATPase subunit a
MEHQRMASEHSNPLDPGHLFDHVKDSTHFEVPRAFAEGGRIEIPQPFQLEQPLVGASGSLEAFDLRLTKFMVLEVVAAVLLIVIFVRLANKARGGDRPRGRFWNLFESMLLFVRDQVARPSIGHHDADRFLPFLWTLFFFVLTCNLLGMVPWAGSPTGALATTGALAVLTFLTVIAAGMLKMGPIKFWTGQVPHMELPAALAIVLKPMIFVLEIIGLFIRHAVLAVRLLANMMAGHLVLAVIMAFIAAAATNALVWYGVAPMSILGATALSMLELFVAFLQAYIFTFLSALFIGMAVHPH